MVSRYMLEVILTRPFKFLTLFNIMPRNIAWHLSLLGCLAKRSARLIGRFVDAQGIARRGGTPICFHVERVTRVCVPLSFF